MKPETLSYYKTELRVLGKLKRDLDRRISELEEIVRLFGRAG